MDIEVRPIVDAEFEECLRSLELSFSGSVTQEDMTRERLVPRWTDGTRRSTAGGWSGERRRPATASRFPGAPRCGGGRHGRRRPADAPAARDQRGAHARAAGRRPCARRADRGAVRLRGRHLRPLRLRLSAFLGEIDFEGGRPRSSAGIDPVGSVRLLPRGEALPAMRAIYDRAQPRRPGMIAMDDAWWEWLFFEKESDKDEPTFFAVHDTDGEPDAYATYRVKHEWPDSIPKLELTVRQLVAVTPDAYADIWRYLFDVDLVHRVKAWNRPVDEPLSFLMEEPRRLRLRIARRVARATRRRARRAGGARLRGRGSRSSSTSRIGSVPGTRAGTPSRCPAGERPRADARTTSPTSPAARPIWAPRIWEQPRSGSSIGPAASMSPRPAALDRVDALFASDPAPWSSFIF